MEIILGTGWSMSTQGIINKLKKETMGLVELKKRNKSKLSISRTEAVRKIIANKGRFFTATFVTNEGNTRSINCNAKSDCITPLGYITVYSPKDKGYRSINPKTLSHLAIAGVQYKVK